jgi:hypothetical protein
VYDDDTQIRRTWDIEEMRNVAHKFSFYMANNEREEAIAKCWVSEPEHTKDASYGMNWGYYVGLDEVKKYLTDPAKVDKFITGMMPMTSWVIEQAHNDDTAQAVFYCIWYDVEKEADGDEAYWYSAKIGVDFIKEADGWKIWHYFAGVDLFCKAGEDFNKQPSTILGDETTFVNPLKAAFGTPTIPMDAYTVKYNWSHYPPLPTPHDTYAETTNCGPTGNPNYKG